jgi:hypothetical protein
MSSDPSPLTDAESSPLQVVCLSCEAGRTPGTPNAGDALNDYADLRPEVTRFDVGLGSEPGIALSEQLRQASTARAIGHLDIDPGRREAHRRQPPRRLMNTFGRNVDAPPWLLAHSAGVEKRNHRRYRAVILAGAGQIQLAHDAAHVLFNGSLGDKKLMSDAGVRTALRH